MGPQQSPAVSLAPERSGKVTPPSAMMGCLGKGGWDGDFLVGEHQLGLAPVQACGGQG